MAALLAARRTLRHAWPDLEHDDVDVRRLVLRRGVGSDHGRQYDGHPARHRLLCCAWHRKTEFAYDQLLFRPVVAWADKFRFEQTASGNPPTSWMLDLFRRTRALRALTLPFAATNKVFSNLHIRLP